MAEAVFGAWKDDMPHEIRISRPIEGYEAVLTFDKAQADVSVSRACLHRTDSRGLFGP